MTFYMTYARSRPGEIVPWVEENDVPLLTNAMHRWSFNTESFLDMWEYDTPHVIDSGGYNVQAKFVNRGGGLRKPAAEVVMEQVADRPYYPWSLQEYHDWLQGHADEFEWAAAMDYACEDRFNKLGTVENRMEWTIRNTIDHYNLNPDYMVLPVLQGRSVDDYVYCYEQYEDHGIPVDYVGVGTICRLSSENKIVELEEDLRDRLGSSVDLHGFGVKINAYKLGATFESADSQAWVYNASNGNIAIDGGTKLRTIHSNCSKTRTVESFKNYYNYVTRLMDGESATDYQHGLDMNLPDSELATRLESRYGEGTA